MTFARIDPVSQHICQHCGKPTKRQCHDCACKDGKIEKLRAEIERLRARAEAAEEGHCDCCSATRAECDRLRAAVHELRDERDELLAKVERLRDLVSEATAGHRMAMKEADMAEARLVECQDSAARLRAANNGQALAIRGMQKARDRARFWATRWKAAAKVFRREIDTVHEYWDDDRAECDDEIDELRREIELHRAVINSMTKMAKEESK